MARKTFRKIITSPELIEQINPENKKLMERFLKNYSTKCSPKTVIGYKSDLSIFFVWNYLQNEDKNFLKVKKIDFMDFFDYGVLELKWASQRYSRIHSCLSSFSTWIERTYDEDEIGNFRNLLPFIDKPTKSAVRPKTVLSTKQIDTLFKELEKQNRVQEQCLLALAISSGARVSELARFTLDLIDENNTAFDGLFIETTREIQTKGRGVNGKMLIKYILKDKFLPYYKKWLVKRDEFLKENNVESDSLFIVINGVNKGNPASADNLKSWIGSWSKILNVDVYPHCLRHLQITEFKRMGLEDDLIVALTGWAEGSGHTMISVYNDLTAKDRKWKGLDKLKTALEQDKVNQENENKLEKENKENENQKENT